jgi:hypothetical protein
MDIVFFQSLEFHPYSMEVSYDTFACSLNEWFMYDNPSNLRNMTSWDGWVMWI